MIRAYRTEINPTAEQAGKIRRTTGIYRFLYNKYIHINRQIYEAMKYLGLSKTLRCFMTAKEFDKYVNNVLSIKEEYKWIKQAGSKARKRAIENAERAYMNFFNGVCKFPGYKRKNRQDVKAYFPKNNKTDWTVDRHRIKIPTLGFVRLKEKNYIPVNGEIISGTISMKANRYYVSVTVEENKTKKCNNNAVMGIGVDLGITRFAVVSNGEIYKNINKTRKVKRLKRQLKHQQKILSRKYEYKKKSKRKEKATKNIDKQVMKVQKLHKRLIDIRHNHIDNAVIQLVKTKPEYIAIENLCVKGMMKNRHLAGAVAEQNFYRFRAVLTNKCKNYGIELRIVKRVYPSSKTCHICGYVNRNLKLSDRNWTCSECSYKHDRDLNAAINLSLTKAYTVVT